MCCPGFGSLVVLYKNWSCFSWRVFLYFAATISIDVGLLALFQWPFWIVSVVDGPFVFAYTVRHSRSIVASLCERRGGEEEMECGDCTGVPEVLAQTSEAASAVDTELTNVGDSLCFVLTYCCY